MDKNDVYSAFKMVYVEWKTLFQNIENALYMKKNALSKIKECFIKDKKRLIRYRKIPVFTFIYNIRLT